MKLYRNIMEDVVEDALDDLISTHTVSFCNCEICHADVMAFALNLLPPKYAATSVGASYNKLSQLRSQQHADILAALTRAIDVVSNAPRHEVDKAAT